MSQPVVVINIQGGMPPCGCSKAGAAVRPVIARTEETSPCVAPEGWKEEPPPGASDPPCDTCGVTYTFGEDIISFKGAIGQSAEGGFPITNVSLTLLDARGGFISSVGLSDAKAADDLSGSYTMLTRQAEQAIFSYIGANRLAYRHQVSVTILPR